MFAKGGMVLSFFATPLTINPNPMNNTRAIKLSAMMLTNVAMPWTKVK